MVNSKVKVVSGIIVMAFLIFTIGFSLNKKEEEAKKMFELVPRRQNGQVVSTVFIDVEIAKSQSPKIADEIKSGNFRIDTGRDADDLKKFVSLMKKSYEFKQRIGKEDDYGGDYVDDDAFDDLVETVEEMSLGERELDVLYVMANWFQCHIIVRAFLEFDFKIKGRNRRSIEAMQEMPDVKQDEEKEKFMEKRRKVAEKRDRIREGLHKKELERIRKERKIKQRKEKEAREKFSKKGLRLTREEMMRMRKELKIL